MSLKHTLMTHPTNSQAIAYTSSKVQTNSVIYLDTGLPSLSSGWPMKSDAKYKVDHNGIEQSLSGYQQSYCTNEPVYVAAST